ncbi:MAG: hypothetical protein FWG65_08430 [Turicibacter sp.]|nr:hypothetical protein [Turicibacter sp.]
MTKRACIAASVLLGAVFGGILLIFMLLVEDFVTHPISAAEKQRQVAELQPIAVADVQGSSVYLVVENSGRRAYIYRIGALTNRFSPITFTPSFRHGTIGATTIHGRHDLFLIEISENDIFYSQVLSGRIFDEFNRNIRIFSVVSLIISSATLVYGYLRKRIKP